MGRLPIGVKALEHIEQYALIIVHLVHDMMYCCNFTNIFHSIFSSKKTDFLSKQKNILFYQQYIIFVIRCSEATAIYIAHT